MLCLCELNNYHNDIQMLDVHANKNTVYVIGIKKEIAELFTS